MPAPWPVDVERNATGLMDGWAAMATRAHEATTFAELREAGGFFRMLTF